MESSLLCSLDRFSTCLLGFTLMTGGTVEAAWADDRPARIAHCIAALSKRPGGSSSPNPPRRIVNPPNPYSNGAQGVRSKRDRLDGEPGLVGIIGPVTSRARALSDGKRHRPGGSNALLGPIADGPSVEFGRPLHGRLERPADVPPQRGCSCSSILCFDRPLCILQRVKGSLRCNSLRTSGATR